MSRPGDQTDPPQRVVEHVTCLGCGCCCDDIRVTVRDGRIAAAERACPLGMAWFGDGAVPTSVLLAGTTASMDAALDEAASLLRRARQPLVYLAPDVSCETQREAIAVADRLRAGLDSVTSDTVAAGILAAQERGRVAATLGEIRNRADVLVFWGVDPAQRYQRYFARVAPQPAGLQVPEGRRSRTVVAVDVGGAHGPADADIRIALPAADEVATLTALDALVRTPSIQGHGDVWDRARELAPTLAAARYVVVVADGEPADDAEPQASSDTGRSAALVSLTQALNGPSRCALNILRGGGNRSGADAVLTSQTGYPMTVDFSRGYPRYLPHDGRTSARLAQGAADLVLVIGNPNLIPAPGRDALAAVPSIVIGPRASDSALRHANVVVDTGVAGIHEPGTAIRLDDVPLPLRPALQGVPDTRTTVVALRTRLAGGAA